MKVYVFKFIPYSQSRYNIFFSNKFRANEKKYSLYSLLSILSMDLTALFGILFLLSIFLLLSLFTGIFILRKLVFNFSLNLISISLIFSIISTGILILYELLLSISSLIGSVKNLYCIFCLVSVCLWDLLRM